MRRLREDLTKVSRMPNSFDTINRELFLTLDSDIFNYYKGFTFKKREMLYKHRHTFLQEQNNRTLE